MGFRKLYKTKKGVDTQRKEEKGEKNKDQGEKRENISKEDIVHSITNFGICFTAPVFYRVGKKWNESKMIIVW